MKAAISTLLFGLMMFASAGTMAVDQITIELNFTPNLEDGKKTYDVCARCHLPEAWGNADGTYPQLAGQHVNVLMKQLLDIRTGKRHSSLMYPFVQQRTIGGYQEMSDVVAYISTLPMNPAHAKGPWGPQTNEYAEGKKIYKKNCKSCHGKKGEGDNEFVYPRLQGQHFQYMNTQLTRVRNGSRGVHPAMQAIVNSMSSDELEKALNYASYFEVPKEDQAPSKDWRNPDFK
jgi:cytochrome c553